MTSTSAGHTPLVIHLVYRFDTGGLENGVVNLIDQMPVDAYRHAVVALTEVVPGFASRIRRIGVEFVSLHKPPGHGARLYPQLVRLFNKMRPAIVHTRNLAALECQVPAAWAGVRGRIHGEHGRDVEDLSGDSRRYQWMRRAYSPFVHRYIALSRDLQSYLSERVGIATPRIRQIYNGVDASRFAPSPGGRRRIAGCPFGAPQHWLVGSVGRMQAVKDQTLLARAFVKAVATAPALAHQLRLVLVGSGPLQAECRAILEAANAASLAWLPGERADVPDVMRGLDCFALPSKAEGISNTILEAMACGLPVVATRVGGNAELVEAGRTGSLVASGDVDAMAAAIIDLATNRPRAADWGVAGRLRVEQHFSLRAMVAAYQRVYDDVLNTTSPRD